jgi:hypothetical protein
MQGRRGSIFRPGSARATYSPVFSIHLKHLLAKTSTGHAFQIVHRSRSEDTAAIAAAPYPNLIQRGSSSSAIQSCTDHAQLPSNCWSSASVIARTMLSRHVDLIGSSRMRTKMSCLEVVSNYGRNGHAGSHRQSHGPATAPRRNRGRPDVYQEKPSSI